jgi:NhaP-type Na+/H+ or K+/H+ antiporter
MVTILEGEGLLNDATALVLYRVAVAAAVSPQPSRSARPGSSCPWPGVGGVAVGLAVGFVGSRILRRVSEAPVGEHRQAADAVRGLAGRRAAPRLGECWPCWPAGC